jgi:hypothetical protein
MTKANKFELALNKINATIVATHEAIIQTRAKAAEAFKTAINYAIDTGKASKMEAGDMRDAIVAVFDAAVAAGHIEKSTARAYMTGLRFALDRGVMWNPSLHSAEGQIQALQDAGKKIPDSLAKKAAELAAKKAERDAKQSKAHVASIDTIVKALAKALADARALGKGELAADILDVIHSIKPEFTEPKAE